MNIGRVLRVGEWPQVRAAAWNFNPKTNRFGPHKN